jgi:hypothetical protein
MTTLKLIAFALRNLAALGYWQAGAEMCGGERRRARADAHRRLQILAADALHDHARLLAARPLAAVKSEG